MVKTAVILGIGSDIGSAIAERLRADGWAVSRHHHDDDVGLYLLRWDLVVCCYGTLEPIGSFWEADPRAWERAFEANLFLPVRQVRRLYPCRNPDASVCFFSGAGTSGPAPTYSAYAASKVALVKMTELMDDESPDCKFFILGPGIVRTKIHDQTVEAGERAANARRVSAFLESGDPGTSMDDIYACLMACYAAPKDVIGGRNVYVPGDLWTHYASTGFPAGDRDAWKLRRDSDCDFRR